VGDPGEKNTITVDISQSLIEEALRSVEKHASRVSRPSTEGASEEEVEGLRAELAESKAEARTLDEKCQVEQQKVARMMAEVERIKRRGVKDRQEAEAFALERFVKDLLPVLDNLERAMDHAKTATDMQGMIQGVAMTRKLLHEALGRNGVSPLSSVGKVFDPNVHEAMQQTESREFPPNTVVAEFTRGYTLNERLVRPALVIVAKAPQPQTPDLAPSGEPVDRKSP
jgi:molecular chaperone GrpE